MLAELLLPGSSDLRLDAVDFDCSGKGLTVTVTTARPAAECPICGQPSDHVQSRYRRIVADLPCADKATRLYLHVRRFFCHNDSCHRSIFTERLPDVVAPWSRRSQRLAREQRQIGQSLRGEAGARLSKQLVMGTSPDTLLRLIRRHQLPDAATPHALGVDDWARRKGHTYGTILVDLEAHKIIDLLRDRTPETVPKWLQDHPGIEVIGRGRAGAYAEAASRGAPQAIQVADRFHLLVNLRETLERLLNRSQAALHEVGRPEAAAEMVVEEEPDHPPAPEPDEHKAIEPEVTPEASVETDPVRAGRRAWRLARYEQVMALHHQGTGIRAIARQLNVSRRLVHRYIRAGCFPEMAHRRKRHSILNRYEPYLREQMASGRENGMQLWREIREQGNQGSRPLVSRWVAQHRRPRPPAKGGRAKERRRRCQVPAAPPPLSPRQGAWLLVKEPAKLTAEEQMTVERLCQASADIDNGYRLGQQFAQMVRDREADALDFWLAEAKRCGLPDLAHFAQGIERDYAAVRAGLSLPWSNGPTEGQVNRLKMIKRQMYGRANFDLLRIRVLAA